MVEAPQTDEGRSALHDFRTVDWDAWRDAPDRERRRAIEGGVAHLDAHEAAEDAETGASAIFSVLGHKTDFVVVHFRPTLDDISCAERQLERIALAAFTEQPTSYVSVTEVSGYVSDDYFEGSEEDIDASLLRYIKGKLKSDIPKDTYMSFYSTSKRHGEEYNWYDFSFDERRDLMSTHGDTGRQYIGKVKQVIASLVGFDDYKWGVILFGDDSTDIKDIVYEMRFDEVSLKYGEFGRFYVGRRFPSSDFDMFLAGDGVPTSEFGDESHHGAHAHGEGGHHGEGGDGHHHHDDGDGDHPHGDDGDEAADGDIRGQLEDLNIYAGKPHGEDVYVTVLYSEADADELFEEVEGLRGNFDHYPTHVKTAVYEASECGRVAVVSIRETTSAAETAAGFLSEPPGIVERAGKGSGFGTMGMFYAVKSEHRGDFVGKFGTVGGLPEEMDDHFDTDLMANVEDEDDMFIASQWRSQDDAMEFFRSDAFRDTVQWGRDVFADRPRHVFLA